MENIIVTINGKENTEYENYLMRDNDQIEIKYEQAKTYHIKQK